METILPRQEIPFGHWGIITEEAFSSLVREIGFDHTVRKIFQKKWDPLATNQIYLDHENKALPDKFSGEYTLISALRDQRPLEHEGKVEVLGHVSPRDTQHESPKVFPAIVDGKQHSILVSTDTAQVHSPFSNQPRLEQMAGHKAVTSIVIHHMDE